MSFIEWMRDVDRKIISLTSGISLLDLPDYPYQDWYEDGYSPTNAADEVLLSAGYSTEY